MPLISNIIRTILTNELRPRRSSQVKNTLKCLLSKRSQVLKYQPLSLSIAAIDRCNFKCDMCHAHSPHINDDFEFKHKPIKDMDFDLFKKVVDKFNMALHISIIGSGEPLLNKNFFKMADYGGHMKMDVSTTTNGLLLDNEIIDKIIGSKLNEITISINGNNDEEFHRLTGMQKDYYAKIIQNVANLVSKKKQTKSQLFIKISFIIDKENYKQIPLMIKLGEKLGVNQVAFIPFLPLPYEGLNSEGKCITISNSEAVGFIDNLKKNEYKVNVIWPLPLNYERRRLCDQYFTLLRVDAYGDIGGCSTMLLNLENNGKYYDEDAWNNEHFKFMRSIFLDMENDRRLEPCKVCINSSC